MKLKIAIQGFAGSFHHLAAMESYGSDIEIFPCASFEALVKITEAGEHADLAVMAIENSIAGSILPNFNLLRQSSLNIIGEVYLQIKQNLLVFPGVTLSDIQEIHSHPMAILQCQSFLDQYNWKQISSEDTALSAARIRQHKSNNIAAIASSLAASLFELDIIAEAIQDRNNNYTRFWILSKRENMQQNGNKGSLYFQTGNLKGQLEQILHIIFSQGLNVSQLQSFPAAGSNGRYYFHADLEFNDIDHFYKTIELIRPLTSELRVYGIY